MMPSCATGLTGGEVALIIILLLFLSGLAGAVGYTYLKRAKRRYVAVKENDVEGAYGSLTSN
jgi:hypothetical protein